MTRTCFKHAAIAVIACFMATIASAQWLPANQTSGPIYYNGGFVGMGTSTPDAPWHLSHFTPYFYMDDTQTAGTRKRVRVISGDVGTTQSLVIAFSSLTGANNLDVLTVNESGRVGIGRVDPGAKLHVEGDAIVSGMLTGNIITGNSITAHYQDVAEWVPATTDMAPGTVVIVNPEATNEVMPSSIEYDVRVAGVVSLQPGLILGVAGASKEQIATTGRVRVKVDASGAPIRIGDLLVTSGKPGMAMRSDAIEIQGRKFHQPGTIIGKALEPLASGEGEILVLLSLQ